MQRSCIPNISVLTLSDDNKRARPKGAQQLGEPVNTGLKKSCTNAHWHETTDTTTDDTTTYTYKQPAPSMNRLVGLRAPHRRVAHMALRDTPLPNYLQPAETDGALLTLACKTRASGSTQHCRGGRNWPGAHSSYTQGHTNSALSKPPCTACTRLQQSMKQTTHQQPQVAHTLLVSG